MTITPAHLEPIAEAVGPFADPAFLTVVHHHFGRGPLVDVATPSARVVLEDVDGTLRGVGHRDLVDYRSPLGPGALEAVVEVVADRALELDSLPVATAEAIGDALSTAGRSVTVTADDTAAVVDLPDTFDEWLADIGKKERHETRRKRRRYEDSVGPVRVVEHSVVGEAFDAFVAMHRSSTGEKGEFMTDEMAAYFADLLTLEGWSLRALVAPDGTLTAAGFGACDDDGYYLYNSAFDRSHADASPGVVLTAALIEDCIERGLARFDFLKGDETYKFRLGARERPLATVVVR